MLLKLLRSKRRRRGGMRTSRAADVFQGIHAAEATILPSGPYGLAAPKSGSQARGYSVISV